MSKKFAVVSKECVACGSCVKICPRGAIKIHKGISASINENKCIGCGKCVNICPAGVISIAEKEDKADEKTLV